MTTMHAEAVSDTPHSPITRAVLANAGLTSLDGMRVHSIPWNREATLRKIENPLSSDSALFLRRWLADFPTEVQLRHLRNLRMQFTARLEEVA